MNDLSNYITKPKNIKELFEQILKIVSTIYNKVVKSTVKCRKNKDKAKMSDEEIISIQLLIECLGMT